MSGCVAIAVNLITFHLRELDKSWVVLIRLELKWVAFWLKKDGLRLIQLKVRSISYDLSMEDLLIDSPRVTNVNSR